VISITGTWFLIQAFLFDNQISISTEPVTPWYPVKAYRSAPMVRRHR
jgi:hypothetical protein